MSRILIVTGMSGAGRSSALRILEDQGWEAVDNLPFALLSRVLRPSEPLDRPLAIGIDSRTRGLVPSELVDELQYYRDAGGLPIRLLFFECDDEVLQRRYTETRRRHPLAQDRPVRDGIALERDRMWPLKATADLVYDTSGTSLVDLRLWMTSQFGSEQQGGLTTTLMSFAFRNGLPREADVVFDVRFLRNPHYVDELRPHTGLDDDVQAYIRDDPDWTGAMDRFEALLVPLLPRYQAEGKSYLTIAVGCTGGKHRSVYTIEELRRRLGQHGWRAYVIHRDIPRPAPVS